MFSSVLNTTCVISVYILTEKNPTEREVEAETEVEIKVLVQTGRERSKFVITGKGYVGITLSVAMQH